MNKKPNALFDKAEKDRFKILELIAINGEQRLSHHPRGKWSINQILSRLITAERLSLAYMQKKSLGIRQVGSTDVFGENEPEKLASPDLVEQWAKVRNELKAFLQQLEGSEIRKKIFKHPVAGRLNVLHAVSFLREHAITMCLRSHAFYNSRSGIPSIVC